LPPTKNFSGNRHWIAMSPDGARIVYVADSQLYVRDLNDLTARTIPGTDESPQVPLEPVFSPDGSSIAYFVQNADGVSLKKILLAGGSGAVTLARVASVPFGASWRNGLIAFGQNGGVDVVAEDGGQRRRVLTIDSARAAAAVQPELLADGKHVVFATPTILNLNRDTASGEGPIVLQSLDGGPARTLVDVGAEPHVLPSGHLVYSHNGRIWGLPFDLRRLEVTSEAPIPLVDGVSQSRTGAGQFSVSRTGSLVYVEGAGTAGVASRRLWWVDRQGREQPIPAPPALYGLLRISPDGTRAAMSKEANIWTWTFATDTPTRLTNEAAVQYNPAWTPDGRFILFDSNDGSGTRIVRRPADGTGKNEVVQPAPAGYPEIITPDQKSLIYHPLSRVAMIVPLDPPGTPRPLLNVKGQVSDAEISPDGRWLAYESTESGRFEVWVRTFPNVDAGRWQISSDGGQHPVWSRDGRELFFIAANRRMSVVAVKGGASFAYGRPAALFDAGPYHVNVARNYDVSPDGRRFLMVRPDLASAQGTTMVVVTNWFDEVRARVR
jgi:serine/threonine-protein kinase